MTNERSIEAELADFGITHERTAHSINSGKHLLKRDGETLGLFDAHEACELLKTLRLS